jgi:hypothetical protein
MITETYEVLARWDFEQSKKSNLDCLRENNFIGATSSTWLRDVAKVVNRRLDPANRDRALTLLAKGGCPLEEWKPILLWHITRDEFLFRDFLINWLFSAYDDGAFQVRPENLHGYLRSIGTRGGKTEHDWTDVTIARVASGLLKMSTDFGILTDSAVKEFAGYHLPQRSLLYLLHAILEQEHGSPQRLIDSDEWHMYLIRSSDLESELLRLHQFRELDYQVAGTLVQLTLPCEDPLMYAQKMAG